MKNITEKLKSQAGINMVDLMMWLVIAALLLATAIQGIGYYQKNAYLYQMKNDTLNAAELVTATVANTDGSFTTDKVAAGTSESTKTADVTIVAEDGANDSSGYVLRTTHPAVTDADVIFLSAQRGSYSPGVHVVPKGTVIDSDGDTTIIAPESGENGTELPAPVVDESSIMTMNWDTTGACSNITLPIADIGNGTTVDWGDGNGPQAVTTSYPSKNFTNLTTNTGAIIVNGTFDKFGNWQTWSASCLESIDSWGDGTKTTSLMGAFAYTENLKLSSINRIPLTVTSLASTFEWSNFNGDISNWDTRNVTDMSWMLAGTPFNGNISNWHTGNVTTMDTMFNSAASFNQDISNWDVSKVEDFGSMFSGATAFNQNIGKWVPSSLTTMNAMFYGASAFNQDISNWDTSKVTDMSQVFQEATSFNQPLVQRAGGWNTSNVTAFQHMFDGAASFNQDLSSWNVSKGTDFSNMFKNASSFNQNLSGWTIYTSNGLEAFYSGSQLTQNHLPTHLPKTN